jgi:hypothetical protein
MSACAQSAMQRKPTAAHKHGGSALRRSGVKHECECAECAKKKGVLQRAAVNENAPEQVPDIVYDVLRSPGQPLDRGTREFMEGRFNHDFSAVRIHTDDRAAESARSVSARAYTVGSDVVFRHNMYRPSTTDGQRLLAHELAHVVQQQGSKASGASGLKLGARHSDEEVRADAAAYQIGAGGNLRSISGRISHTVQREYVEEDAAGCGVCSNAGKTGVEVHNAVLSEYAKKYRLADDAPYFQIDGDYKKPDLRRITESNDFVFIEIGELKPYNSDGVKKGHKQIDNYKNQIKAAFKLAGNRSSTKKFSISGLNNIPSLRISHFVDPKSGRCTPREQTITVDSDGDGLFLYSCDPRRSQLRAEGCCDKRKKQKEQFPVPIHNDLKKSKSEDREKPKSEERPVLEEKTKDKSPNPILDFPDAARVVAEFILKNLTLQGQIDQINAVAKFFSEPRNLAIVGLGVAILSLGPEALLVALSLPVTWPALALAALIIATVAASHTGENPAAIAAPPMA